MSDVLYLIILFVPIIAVGIWIKTPSARKFFGAEEKHEVKK